MCGNGLKQGCPSPSPSLAGEGVDGSHSCSWAATAPDWHIFCFPLTHQAVCILLSAPGKDGSLWDKGSMMRQGWYWCQPPLLDLLLHGSAHCQNSVIPVFWAATACKTNLLLYKSYFFTPDWGLVEVLSHWEVPWRLCDLGCGCSPTQVTLFAWTGAFPSLNPTPKQKAKDQVGDWMLN